MNYYKIINTTNPTFGLVLFVSLFYCTTSLNQVCDSALAAIPYANIRQHTKAPQNQTVQNTEL
jgi:hypothetical protein